MAVVEPLCLCGIRGCPRAALVRETAWLRMRRSLRDHLPHRKRH